MQNSEVVYDCLFIGSLPICGVWTTELLALYINIYWYERIYGGSNTTGSPATPSVLLSSLYLPQGHRLEDAVKGEVVTPCEVRDLHVDGELPRAIALAAS